VQLETFQVESWLNYHGEKLEKRFQLSAYKMMNQLLKTIDTRNHESLESLILRSKPYIHCRDQFGFVFTARENKETYNEIKNLKIMYSIVRLTRNTGTMPLMEYEQLDNLLEVVFKNKKADENSLVESRWLMGRNQYRFGYY
jgi:homoserine acetyltransferase